MSIIWVMSFGFVLGTHHQHHYHLRDAFFLFYPAAAKSSQCTGDHKSPCSSSTHREHHPTYEQQEITKPVPCNPPSAHHEHHLDDVFRARPGHASSPSSAKSSQCTGDPQKSLLLEHPAARTMSIIRVMVSASYLSGPFQLQKESHVCATRDHKARALQSTQRAS